MRTFSSWACRFTIFLHLFPNLGRAVLTRGLSSEMESVKGARSLLKPKLIYKHVNRLYIFDY